VSARRRVVAAGDGHTMDDVPQTVIELHEPGVIVTASSIWRLDGRCYVRQPRHTTDTPRRTESLDGALDDDVAVEYRQASLEQEQDGSWRLHVIPTGRSPHASGIYSGTVEATSFPVDGVARLGAAIRDDAVTYPPSPVPRDEELWPNELPFTAFGQWGIDQLDLRVFDQDRYWVDRYGVGHEIDDMSDDYVRNVIAMLEAQAEQFHVATVVRVALEVVGDALLGRIHGEVLASELGVGGIVDVDTTTWLESTPLMRRLRDRLP